MFQRTSLERGESPKGIIASPFLIKSVSCFRSKCQSNNKQQTKKQKNNNKYSQAYNTLSSLPPVFLLHQVGDDEESCPIVAMGTVNTCSTHRYAYIDRILPKYNIRWDGGRACGVMVYTIRTCEIVTISAEDTDEKPYIWHCIK